MRRTVISSSSNSRRGYTPLVDLIVRNILKEKKVERFGENFNEEQRKAYKKVIADYEKIKDEKSKDKFLKAYGKYCEESKYLKELDKLIIKNGKE